MCKFFSFLLFFIIYFSTFYIYSQDENIVFIQKIQNKAIQTIDFSADNNFLAFGSDDKKIYLIDISKYSTVAKLENFNFPVKCIKFFNNDQFFVASGTDINLIDSKGSIYQSYKGYTTHIWSIDYNSNSQIVVAGSYGPKVIVWDLLKGNERISLKGHKESVLAVAISHDGNNIATGSLDKSVIVWSLNGEILMNGKVHTDNILSVKFHPSGKFLLSASLDKTARLWNIADGKVIFTYPAENHVLDAIFTNDGNHILCALSNGDVDIWQTFSGNKIYTFKGLKGMANTVTISNDNQYIAGGSTEGQLAIWKLSKKILVDFYFKSQIEQDIKDAGIITSKLKNESQKEYLQRKIKEDEKLNELIEKYYKSYTDSINYYKSPFLQ